MPCGSTPSNPTKTPGAASPTFPDPGRFWRIPLAWLTEIALWLDGVTNTGNFTNSMTTYSPTLACRGQPLKKRGGLP